MRGYEIRRNGEWEKNNLGSGRKEALAVNLPNSKLESKLAVKTNMMKRTIVYTWHLWIWKPLQIHRCQVYYVHLYDIVD